MAIVRFLVCLLLALVIPFVSIGEDAQLPPRALRRRGVTDEQIVPAEQSPSAWNLVSGDITLILADGRQLDFTLSHDFAPLENATTLPSSDILRIARALKIVTNQQPQKSKEGKQPLADLQKLIENARDRVLPVSRLRYARVQPVIFFGPAVHVSEIHFLNKDRTKAELHYRYGASGGSAIFEKNDGRWIATEKGSRWIS